MQYGRPSQLTGDASVDELLLGALSPTSQTAEHLSRGLSLRSSSSTRTSTEMDPNMCEVSEKRARVHPGAAELARLPSASGAALADRTNNYADAPVAKPVPKRGAVPTVVPDSDTDGKLPAFSQSRRSTGGLQVARSASFSANNRSELDASALAGAGAQRSAEEPRPQARRSLSSLYRAGQIRHSAHSFEDVPNPIRSDSPVFLRQRSGATGSSVPTDDSAGVSTPRNGVLEAAPFAPNSSPPNCGIARQLFGGAVGMSPVAPPYQSSITTPSPPARRSRSGDVADQQREPSAAGMYSREDAERAHEWVLNSCDWDADTRSIFEDLEKESPLNGVSCESAPREGKVMHCIRCFLENRYGCTGVRNKARESLELQRRGEAAAALRQSQDEKDYRIPHVLKHYFSRGDNSCSLISPETAAQVVRGENSKVDRFLIIDARFPYEYKAGHIKGALNLYRMSDVMRFFFSSPFKELDGTTVVMVHCEFSSRRAPELTQFIRKLDRNLNASVYPHLFYNNLYVIDGGYKRFFEQYPNLCEPARYLQMLDDGYQPFCRAYLTLIRSDRASAKEKSVEELHSSEPASILQRAVAFPADEDTLDAEDPMPHEEVQI